MGKKAFDFLIAVALLLLMAPVLVIVAGLVAVCLGRPVLFRQKRPGRDGVPFELLKFRTMTDRRDGDGNLLPDSKRLTRLGKILRMSSLDELPELFNVIRGEMSLVGPRPLLMEYLSRYTTEQKRRHDVPPGITGWAQVNGRNSLSWEEKFQMDVWYVDNRSLLLDCKILLMTLLTVVSRQGVSAEGHVTMPAFAGDENSSAESNGKAEFT